MYLINTREGAEHSLFDHAPMSTGETQTGIGVLFVCLFSFLCGGYKDVMVDLGGMEKESDRCTLYGILSN